MRNLGDTVKINVKEIVSEGVDWIQLAQDSFQWQGKCKVKAKIVPVLN
jgi:hypothetical protein